MPLDILENNFTPGDGTYWDWSLSDLTGYNLISIKLWAVPQRYLNVVDANYYYPNSFQPGVATNTTGGYPHAIDMLYST